MQNPTDEAIREYIRELRDDPESRIFAPLAEALTARGRPADAELLCTRGLAVHPDFHDGRLARSRSLLRLGRFEEARDDARKAAAINPRSGEAFTLLSASLYKLGAETEALEAVRRALRLTPEDAVARQLLVRLEATSGKAGLLAEPPPRASPPPDPSEQATPGPARPAQAPQPRRAGGATVMLGTPGPAGAVLAPVSPERPAPAPAGGTTRVRAQQPQAPGARPAATQARPAVPLGPLPPAALEEKTPLVGPGRPFPPSSGREPSPAPARQPLPAAPVAAMPVVAAGAGLARTGALPAAASPSRGPLPPAALEEPTPLVGSSRALALAAGLGAGASSVFPVAVPAGGAPLSPPPRSPSSITSMLVARARAVADPTPGPKGAIVRTAVAQGQPDWVGKLQALIDELPVRPGEAEAEPAIGLPARDLILGLLAAVAVVFGSYAGIRAASRPARMPPGSELVAPPKLGPLAIVPVVPLSLGAPTLVAPAADAGLPAPVPAPIPLPALVPAGGKDEPEDDLVEEVGGPGAAAKGKPKGKPKGGGKPKKKGRR